jgi:hypothetical protein
MRIYRSGWLKSSIIKDLKRCAATGVFNGHPGVYTSNCTAIDLTTGSVLIYTRDVGMHTSGWLKNPDYERCVHLSISFRNPLNLDEPIPFEKKIAQEWVECFFGEYKRFVVCEMPVSTDGKRFDVHHYRIFCDENWFPIIPRGEVYSTEFTELGWKSFSELHPDDSHDLAACPQQSPT